MVPRTYSKWTFIQESLPRFVKNIENLWCLKQHIFFSFNPPPPQFSQTETPLQTGTAKKNRPPSLSCSSLNGFLPQVLTIFTGITSYWLFDDWALWFSRKQIKLDISGKIKTLHLFMKEQWIWSTRKSLNAKVLFPFNIVRNTFKVCILQLGITLTQT